MDDGIFARLTSITDEEQTALKDRVPNRAVYMQNDSNVINAKKMLDSGKHIAMRPHVRFVHFFAHTHDYIEMVYMYSGKTTHKVNGQRIELSTGEVLILNQHAVQEILPAGAEDIAVNFIILPQFFLGLLEMIGEEETPLRRFIIDSIAGRENNCGYLYFKTADVLPIQNLFENLIFSFLNPTSNKRKINELTVGLLLLELINHSDRLVYESKEKNIMVQVFKYIEENYLSGSLTEMAVLLHYDYFWISRVIKEKTGQTFTQLMQEKRLSQAGYLLQKSSMNIIDIAASVGYSNMSYFHRIFVARFGMSPKKYRDGSKRAFARHG